MSSFIVKAKKIPNEKKEYTVYKNGKVFETRTSIKDFNFYVADLVEHKHFTENKQPKKYYSTRFTGAKKVSDSKTDNQYIKVLEKQIVKIEWVESDSQAINRLARHFGKMLLP